MKFNHPHLTAKERGKISFPTNWLLRNKHINGRVLDYGCGLGADVKALIEKNIDTVGYDPHYSPQYPSDKFDTIICNYVFNVLEKEHELRLLLQVSSLLNEGGIAYISVRRDIKYEGYRTHKVHKETTYQRNVILPFDSIYKNEFCEIYQIKRFTDLQNYSNCIFCSPSKQLRYIAESSHVYCTYDGSSLSKGNVLIIPKQHIDNYFELNCDLQQEIWTVVNHLKKYLDKKYHPDGFNISVDINESAGQTVSHVHVSIIPSYLCDTPKP